MIASVHGNVLALTADGAVVQVGGVGIRVHTTPTTRAKLRIGETAQLATSLVVREDSLTLYGFADDDERLVFELLQTASGVGPRLALAILTVHSPHAIRQAVASSDTAALTKVSGIGKKGAERLVLELRDRIGAIGLSENADLNPDQPAMLPPWRDQLRAALMGLGWSAREADDGVAAVAPEAEQGADVTMLLRSALRTLGPR